MRTAGISDELAAATALIDATLKAQPIDPDRVYLTGLSMGGYGTFDWLARDPDRFAAAVAVCGGGDPATADQFKDVPLWVAHGDADPAVPVERSREIVAALRDAGGSPIYIEYPGVNHFSWTPTYGTPRRGGGVAVPADAVVRRSWPHASRVRGPRGRLPSADSGATPGAGHAGRVWPRAAALPCPHARRHLAPRRPNSDAAFRRALKNHPRRG